MVGAVRSQSVVSKEIRFHREQAEKCRQLFRLTDEIRRGLTYLADECDDRARQAEDRADAPRMERPVPLPQPSRAIEPLTLSIKDTGRVLGLGRSTIYRLIGDGQLETIKVGNRTLIKTASIRSLVDVQAE
jgi:excisionase family DNA binding protein